tara:strand:- start:746 stop:1318 length:573 start_codon:yes stop_codon:yes gene_type:complete
MIITIHQPNFMPWYPYFQKMQQADVFVVLENCQFEKNNFQNRFKLNDRWYTMSTNKRLLPIVEKKYSEHLRDWEKIKRRLPEYREILQQFDSCITESLSETNFNIILKIKDLLNISTEVIKDYKTGLTSTDRLVEICKLYGAKEYISGPSGKNYLDLDKFTTNSIKVSFQDPDVEKINILDFLKRLENVR